MFFWKSQISPCRWTTTRSVVWVPAALRSTRSIGGARCFLPGGAMGKWDLNGEIHSLVVINDDWWWWLMMVNGGLMMVNDDQWLVGGLVAMNFIFPFILGLCHHLNWLSYFSVSNHPNWLSYFSVSNHPSWLSYFSVSDHPSWLSYFSEGWPNHQPA